MLRLAIKDHLVRFGGKFKEMVALNSAMAATEFAIILPVMLVCYLGTVEVGGGITVDRKLSNLALTLSNLTARAQGALQDSDINGIMNASAAVLAPYNSAQAGMVVTSFVFDTATPPNAYVVWSNASGPGVNAMTPSCTVKISSTVVPNTLRTASGSIIMAQAKYPYAPAIGYVVTGTINLSETNFMVPRNLASVPRTNSVTGKTYSTCSGGNLA
jgi:Flp pilus assembly protein TadG